MAAAKVFQGRAGADVYAKQLTESEASVVQVEKRPKAKKKAGWTGGKKKKKKRNVMQKDAAAQNAGGAATMVPGSRKTKEKTSKDGASVELAQGETGPKSDEAGDSA